jgi:hypothetical protein
MKLIKISGFLAVAAIVLAQSACVDLDLTPKTKIPVESYFNTSSQLEAYVNSSMQPNDNVATSPFRDYIHGSWSWGAFGFDNTSDNIMQKNANDQWTKTLWTVPADDNTNADDENGEWNFSLIYDYNYFLHHVLPKYEAGQISGDANLVKHHIGEIYFLRAWTYFRKLQNFGDFPIVTEILPAEFDALVAASERAPRNEVARFILDDLDKAISLLNDNQRNTRISKRAAHLLKSRVALHEGTWLKYFKGTAFVPGGSGWPGAGKDYNSGFTVNIDAEIDFFLTEAMNSAKIVADATTLTANNGVLQQSTSDPANAYLNMFGQVDLASVNEVILWKPYQTTSGGNTHGVPVSTHHGAYTNGLTRFYVDNFLMANGKPIYAADSGYKGDNDLKDVVDGRDNRLFLFLKVPGQLNYFLAERPDRAKIGPEKYPDITTTSSEVMYSTGYTPRKGINFSDYTQYTGNNSSTTGAIIFRGVEAYLNYMEACVEKTGSLDGTGQAYWAAVRSRGNAATTSYADIQANTIANTVMAEEAKTDFGAYSAGVVLSDPVLYNIRRERRMELMAEGLRMMDLRRWRALDQLISTPQHFEGFRLWGDGTTGMFQHDDYFNVDASGNKTTKLTYGPNGTVSAPASEGGSNYLRPAEINPGSVIATQGGHSWMMAHYLYPIATAHFSVSSPDGATAANSPIYQNPYWPTEAAEHAEQ